MKTRVTPVTLLILILVGGVAACSTASRETPKSSVAIMVSMPGGAAPSPAEVASIHKAMQPEIAKYGRVLASNPRTADYVVYVRYTGDPEDPVGPVGRRITFVKVQRDEEASDGRTAAREKFKRESDRAIAEMVREPR